MHNLLSRAQLDEWRHLEDTLDEFAIEEQKISDYYECLIECDIQNCLNAKEFVGVYLMNIKI